MEKTKTAEQYIKELEWRSSALYYTLQRVHNTIGVIPRTLTAEIEERLKGGPLPEASAPLPPSPEPPVATTGLKEWLKKEINETNKWEDTRDGISLGRVSAYNKVLRKLEELESSQPINQ